MTLIGVSFAIALAISKTRLWIFFASPDITVGWS